ncbi:MAG TPA: response regulator, partial [Gemmatimonadaceae bacterium]
MIAGIEHIQSSTRVWPRPPRILVVDDEELTIRLLCRVLGAAGYDSIMMTTDALEAVSIVRRTPPDLVVLDLHMPGFDGFEVLQEMQNA